MEYFRVAHGRCPNCGSMQYLVRITYNEFDGKSWAFVFEATDNGFEPKQLSVVDSAVYRQCPKCGKKAQSFGPHDADTDDFFECHLTQAVIPYVDGMTEEEAFKQLKASRMAVERERERQQHIIANAQEEFDHCNELLALTSEEITDFGLHNDEVEDEPFSIDGTAES